MRAIGESAFGLVDRACLAVLAGTAFVLVSNQGHCVDGQSVKTLTGLEQHHGFVCHTRRCGIGHIDGQHSGRGIIERCRALDLALRLRVHDPHAALLQFHRFRQRVLQHQGLSAIERGAGGVHIDGVVDVWCRGRGVGRFLIHQLRRIDPSAGLIRDLGHAIDADHGAVPELAAPLQCLDVLQTCQIADLDPSAVVFRFGQRRARVLEGEGQGVLPILRWVGGHAHSVERRAGLVPHRHAARNVFHVGGQRVGDGHVLRAGCYIVHAQGPTVLAVGGVGPPVHAFVHVVVRAGVGRGLRGFAEGDRVVDRARGSVLHRGGIHDVQLVALRELACNGEREALVAVRILDLVVRCGVLLGMGGVGVDLHIVVQRLPVSGGRAIVAAVRILPRAVLVDGIRDRRAIKVLLRGERGLPLDGGCRGSAGQGPLGDVAFGTVDGHGAGAIEVVAVAVLAIHGVGVRCLRCGIGVRDRRGVGDDVPAIAFRQCRRAVYQVRPLDLHRLLHGPVLVVFSVAFDRHIAGRRLHAFAEQILDHGVPGIAVVARDQLDIPVDVVLVAIGRAALVHCPLGFEHQALVVRLLRGFVRLDRHLVVGDVQIAVLALRTRFRAGFAGCYDLLAVHLDLVLHVQLLAIAHARDGQGESLAARIRRRRPIGLAVLRGQSRVGEQLERIRVEGEELSHRIGDGHIGVRPGGTYIEHVVVDTVAVGIGFAGVHGAVLVDVQAMFGVNRRFDIADAREIPISFAAIAFVVGAACDLAVDGHVGVDAAAGVGGVGVGGNDLVVLHGEGSALFAGAVIHRVGGAVLEGDALRQIVGEGGPLLHLHFVGHLPGEFDPDLSAVIQRHAVGVVLPVLAAIRAELHLRALLSRSYDPTDFLSGQVIACRLGVFRRNQHASQQHAQHHGNGGKRFHIAL